MFNIECTWEPYLQCQHSLWRRLPRQTTNNSICVKSQPTLCRPEGWKGAQKRKGVWTYRTQGSLWLHRSIPQSYPACPTGEESIPWRQSSLSWEGELGLEWTITVRPNRPELTYLQVHGTATTQETATTSRRLYVPLVSSTQDTSHIIERGGSYSLRDEDTISTEPSVA